MSYTIRKYNRKLQTEGIVSNTIGKMGLFKNIKNKKSLMTKGGVSKSVISQAELDLGLKFATDYADYLKWYGVASGDGFELTGLGTDGHNNVVKATVEERALNKHIRDDMYLLENIGIGGILYWQDSSGNIYQTRYDGRPTHYASSLREYVDMYE